MIEDLGVSGDLDAGLVDAVDRPDGVDEGSVERAAAFAVAELEGAGRSDVRVGALVGFGEQGVERASDGVGQDQGSGEERDSEDDGAGEALLAPSITRRLIEDFVSRPIAMSPDPRLGQLTAREREVLGAVARGLSNAELADELFMSHATAKTHVSHLLTKFAARDRAQLVVAAYETGLTTPGRL